MITDNNSSEMTEMEGIIMSDGSDQSKVNSNASALNSQAQYDQYQHQVNRYSIEHPQGIFISHLYRIYRIIMLIYIKIQDYRQLNTSNQHSGVQFPTMN